MTMINPILIGSRRYGVNDEDSDWNYLLIVPESKIHSIISTWGDNLHSADTGYRGRGIITEEMSNILHAPVGAQYDVIMLPRPDTMTDSRFILENINVYRMIRIDKVISPNMDADCDLKSRLRAIRTWAKTNNVYGGAYPNGTGYLIYAINTMKKGYSVEKAIKMLSTRCLYSHDEYKYKLVSYVHDRSYKYMADVYANRVNKDTYQYQIVSNCTIEVLRHSHQLLDSNSNIMYIENNGIIHSASDAYDDIKVWCDMHNVDVIRSMH